MKLKDICILNWVLYEGKPCRVWCIDWQYRLVRCHSNGQEWNCDPDELQPIPLDKELLKGNGFEYDTTKTTRDTFDGKWYHSVGRFESFEEPKQTMNVSDFVITEDNKEFWVFNDSVQIRYVHELQRVLCCVGLSRVADNLKVKR